MEHTVLPVISTMPGKWWDGLGTADSIFRAFITGPDGIGMIDLGTLGGTSSIATGINDSGQVVGSFYSNGYHAFITDLNGSMIDLGTLGGPNSDAYDINDSGEVVGWADINGIDSHAFLFSHGGMTDLNMLNVVVAAGWSDLYVGGINNNGQMVGYGQHNGHSEAFLLSYTPDTVFTPNPIFIPTLSPIPEPEIYAMLLTGLGLLGVMARRRKGVIV